MSKVEYHHIPKGYTMKCRLYPNKKQEELIDRAIYAVQSFYNCTLYEIYHNLKFTKEKFKKDKDGNVTDEIIHFVKFSEISKAEWKNRLLEEHPAIGYVPSGAILSNVSGVVCDMKKSLGKDPIEFQKPPFYNKVHRRMSCSWQEAFSKVHTNVEISDNPDETELNRNVLYIDLNKIGRVKIRGWNKKIRFDKDGQIDFMDYIHENKRKQVIITISKDKCCDYYICFKLQDVYKPMDIPEQEYIGCDVGIRSLLITSDGEKYDNRNFKKENLDHIKNLNKQLSRRQGWANPEFREQYKKNKELVPSKRYEETRLEYAKLSREIQRKRELHNHEITKKIVSDNKYIGIEGLDVKNMFLNKHLTFALSDAAMSSVLAQLKYKSEWHNREIKAINQWTPSSKRCSCCGYINKKLKSQKTWVCPECQTKHDRDINAAKNILYYSLIAYYGEYAGITIWNSLDI